MVLLEMKFLSVLERISLPGFCCFVNLSADHDVMWLAVGFDKHLY